MLNWLLKNHSNLKITVNFDEIYSAKLPGFYRAWSKFSWHSQEILSQGVACKKEEAIAKCLSEMVERVTGLSSNALTSNGFAAHINDEKAINCARSELIERDAFFCHYLTKIPFETLDFQDALLGMNESIIKFYRAMQNLGIDFRLGRMRCIGSQWALIAAASNLAAPPKFGVMLCTGSGDNFIEVLSKLLLDLAINLIWARRVEKIDCLSASEFCSIVTHSPTHHQQLGYSLNQRTWFERMFPSDCMTVGSKNLGDNHPVKQETQITLTKHPIPKQFKYPPIVVYQAKCDRLQNHFFGMARVETINLERLSEFAGQPLAIQDLDLEPHPYG